MIKAIFFDVDGTLVSFRTHQMPESTRKALGELRNRGVKLFLATGRALEELEQIKTVLNFEFDGYVIMNGQYCYDDFGVVHEQPLPSEDLAAILPYMEEEKIAGTFVEKGYSYLNIVNDRILHIRKMMGSTLPEGRIDDVNRVFSNTTYQISVCINGDEEAEFIRHMPGCRLARWHEMFADVIPANGGKGIGIRKMLEHYGMTTDESMAFGDGENDMEMLEEAGIGVAMGNSLERLKEVADYVTADVDEDGLRLALEHYGVL